MCCLLAWFTFRACSEMDAPVNCSCCCATHSSSVDNFPWLLLLLHLPECACKSAKWHTHSKRYCFSQNSQSGSKKHQMKKKKKKPDEGKIISSIENLIFNPIGISACRCCCCYFAPPDVSRVGVEWRAVNFSSNFLLLLLLTKLGSPRKIWFISSRLQTPSEASCSCSSIG